jgi:hypothetical protein
MSAWEGSEAQRQSEERAKDRQAEVDRIQAQNPWLSRQDCEEWQQKQEEVRRPPPKCCPCMGQGPGIVRHKQRVDYDHATESFLGPCVCDCHKLRPR